MGMWPYFNNVNDGIEKKNKYFADMASIFGPHPVIPFGLGMVAAFIIVILAMRLN